MSSIHHKHLLPLGSRLPQSRSSENLPPPPEKTCNPRRIYRNPTKTKRTFLHPPLQTSRESQPLLQKACKSCRRPTSRPECPCPRKAGTTALLPYVELISDFMHCCMMRSGSKLLKQVLRRSSTKLKYRR